MAYKPVPGIIFSMEFFTLDGENPRPWKAGENTFLDYMARPEAFDESKHLHDEYSDFMDYMKNEEKSDGIFDIENDRLSSEQIEHYRTLEISSWKQNCPRYVGVMSFTNEFLKEVGVLTENGLDTKKLKEVARSGMSEMIHTSKKLDDDNVYWTAAIHTNTDNVHVHYSILEYEKRYRERDKLEVVAFDKLKSKVANQLIGNERITALTKLARENILPDFQREILSEHSEILHLAKILPENQTWQYARESFAPYRKQVDRCVDSIIQSSPELQNKFDYYVKQLDLHSEKLAKIYGVGERHLYKDFKQNKLKDFYNRAGNALLNHIKENGIKDLQAPLSKATCRPTEKENDWLDYLAEKAKHSYSDSRRTKRFRTSHNSKEYLKQKQNLARIVEIDLKNLAKEYEYHVDRLLNEFEYEQDLQIQRGNY